MGRKSAPPLTVKVVARGARGVYVFRWFDHEGKAHQCNSEIEIGGPSAAAERKTRNAAERAAGDKQAELIAEYAAAVAAAAAAKLRESESWSTQIDAYVAVVRQGGKKGRRGGATEHHCEQVRSQLRRFAAEARTKEPGADELRPLATVREISERSIQDFLGQLLRRLPKRRPPKVQSARRQYKNSDRPPKLPRPPQVVQPASIQTKNHYLTTIKAFCAHLTRKRILADDPSQNLIRPSPDTDLRHDRRALTPAEFARLIQAAQKGPVVETMSGPDRAMMYITATWTGYRRKELASLTLRHFEFGGGEPHVRIDASDAKNRKRDRIPLHPKLVESLRSWIASKGVVSLDRPVFDLRTPGGELRNTAKMMQRDLAAAGLPYQDENGLYADFHANRAAFIVNLVESNVPFFRVVDLARHADPKTTKRYDRSTMKQRADGIMRLPAPPSLDGIGGGESPAVIRFGGA